MADKDVPIKEQEDGSVLAKVEVPEGFDEDEGVEVELKEGGKVEASDDSECCTVMRGRAPALRVRTGAFRCNIQR